jgi:hypothetical protein
MLTKRGESKELMILSCLRLIYVKLLYNAQAHLNSGEMYLQQAQEHFKIFFLLSFAGFFHEFELVIKLRVAQSLNLINAYG